MTLDGKSPVLFRKYDGSMAPIQFGVTTYCNPAEDTLFVGESGMKNVRNSFKSIFWLPEIKDDGMGIAIYIDYYKRVQDNPEQYPEDVAKLEQWHIPLNLDCDMKN